jgi:CHAD domain-containing protein
MDLLERPVEEACRLVSLGYLDEALAARGRIGHDDEALHDLRVALRRLRSTLRAYRRVLGQPLDRRDRRRLRQIVASTSMARDAEVLRELVVKQLKALEPGERAGAEWLAARLAERRSAGYDDVAERLAELPRLERRLRRRLSSVQLDLSHPHAASQLVGELIAAHAGDLEDDLAELRAPDQVEDAHAARISVKRLRYLIEPFKDDAAVARLVAPCKSLQDLLGNLHDAHVAMAEVRAALGAPETPAAARDGLAALAVRLELRQLRLFATVKHEWLDGGLVAQARALGAELRDR